MTAPLITITRKDNGVSDLVFKHEGKVIKISGYWDDATPWKAGTYAGSYWLFHGKYDAFRFETDKNIDPIEGRTRVVLHNGIRTGDSEGCVIDGTDFSWFTNGFIDKIYDYLRDKRPCARIPNDARQCQIGQSF